MPDASPHQPNDPTTVDRRGFFRAAAAAGVGAVALLAFRNTGDQQAAADCINQHICRGCPASSGCGLPEAISYRTAMSNRGPDA